MQSGNYLFIILIHGDKTQPQSNHHQFRLVLRISNMIKMTPIITNR
jgi:hypothetical protein